MTFDTFRFNGHRLSRAERRHWRFVLCVLGVIVVLASYALPMFPQRITRGTTRYTGGTVTYLHFPTLVNGQHLSMGQTPTKEDLESVAIQVAPVSHSGSAWAWLGAVMNPWPDVLHISFFLCLALPFLSALVGLVLVAWSWKSPGGLPERLIAPSIYLPAIALGGVVLAWFHQFDFSTTLLAMERQALNPAIGFYGVLVGLGCILVATFGFRHETHRDVINWWALVFAVGLTIWLLARFRPYPYLVIWRFVLDGIGVTLRIVATSFVFILIVSLFGGLGRISKSKVIYGAASLYVELVRGIPLLVQLLFIWFALPSVFDSFGGILISLDLLPMVNDWGQALVDLRLSPFTAAVVGLTVCYGAYGSEIFRAGISSIHHGQMEAARSLGMTYIQAMRYVILPQAVRVILPPVGNEFVALLKDSSLVSVLAVSDLTRRGREFMARTFMSFDTWILVALCYLVMTLFSSRVVEYIESKTKAGR